MEKGAKILRLGEYPISYFHSLGTMVGNVVTLLYSPGQNYNTRNPMLGFIHVSCLYDNEYNWTQHVIANDKY